MITIVVLNVKHLWEIKKCKNAHNMQKYIKYKVIVFARWKNLYLDLILLIVFVKMRIYTVQYYNDN